MELRLPMNVEMLIQDFWAWRNSRSYLTQAFHGPWRRWRCLTKPARDRVGLSGDTALRHLSSTVLAAAKLQIFAGSAFGGAILHFSLVNQSAV